MNEIDKIKGRLGRNSRGYADVSTYTRGAYKRSKAVRADHKRSLAESFGYPVVITPEQHYNMANRNGIAYNLCYGIVKDCWRVPPTIYDGEVDESRRTENPTEFEKAIDEHFERLRVWEYLEDLDYCQRPMRYGGLFFLTSDKDGVMADQELVRMPSIDYLVGFRVYSEAQLPVDVANQNINSTQYGKPIMYNVKTDAAGSTNENENIGYSVHASRVYAFGEGAMGDSIYGVPALESSYEALMDLSKVRGSSAEGFFQNASSRYINSLDKEATINEAEAIIDSQEQFDNDFSRSMVTTGSVTLMQSTLSDPSNPWTVAVNEACSAHSKPMTIVVGHQTGERASGEDILSWNRVIMDRQQRTCGRIIKGFIKELQDKFTFPKPKNGFFEIDWRDLNEISAIDRVELAYKMAQTNETMVKAKMMPVFDEQYIQTEAGAPVESLDIDIGGEDDNDEMFVE